MITIEKRQANINDDSRLVTVEFTGFNHKNEQIAPKLTYLFSLNILEEYSTTILTDYLLKGISDFIKELYGDMKLLAVPSAYEIDKAFQLEKLHIASEKYKDILA
jgi:hypothetical protein